ncbi:kappaPI-actitoxin-Avd3c-like [Musca domestica]|uniref:KappaPI-actitoxin-Avd3c-like n=1 Tax=Musca domestica TaxID=7370 RepID=A0A1I8NJ01_MUSDO|nr:kappaPI-actitoxin-Avd3c [Musca domestica]XP_058981834.1 kappaPI-actitoxin-Avd3c-like [Musca domestica]
MHLQSIIIAVLAFLACVSAQACVGRPRNPSCSGPRDLGIRGRRCTPRTMWYYDPRDRQCKEMRYRGCRGNNNRHCTKAACERQCRR